jgi:hypothetical protein
MFVRFQVLTAASMKVTVFWDVTPCSLVEVYRRFRGACCLHHQGGCPEASVNFYQTIWRNTLEGSHLHGMFVLMSYLQPSRNSFCRVLHLNLHIIFSNRINSLCKDVSHSHNTSGKIILLRILNISVMGKIMNGNSFRAE